MIRVIKRESFWNFKKQFSAFPGNSNVLFRKLVVRCPNFGSPPFLHKPILYTLGPAQPIQHTIVPPRADYSTSVVLQKAAIYDADNRSNMRRFCTCFGTACDDSAQPPIHHKPIPHVLDSTQPVSTHQFFNTTRFYTSVFLHKAGPAPPFSVFAHEYISGR